MSIFRRLPIIALSLSLGFLGCLQATERTSVTILATTDLHGRILPLNYSNNQPAELGLAKISTLVKQAREKDPELLLLDCGDTIQGTPLIYLHNRVNNEPIDPMMLVMNHMGYDALTVGNHEYNFGLKVLNKSKSEATFPWLSANSYRSGTDEVAYQPYLIKKINGVRLAVIGLTTPGIPTWENPENYAGLEFRNPVEEAKKWVAKVRHEEQVDAVILSVHMGIEESLDRSSESDESSSPENTTLAIAREVPGVDLILMGHTHRTIPNLTVNGVLMAQAGRWGDHLVNATLYFAREEGESDWTLTAKQSDTITINADVEADPEILALAEPYEEEAQAWLNQVIGHSDKLLTAGNTVTQDNALLDLVQQVQLDAGDADVSMAANFNSRARIEEGPITVRDIANLYIYENTLYVVELTGAQLKEALEHSARYFLPYEAGKTPKELINRNVRGYNFDLAQGVDYTIDLRRPVGDRITGLSFEGHPVKPDQILRVAINNYRYNGGGGYSVYQDAPVVYRSSKEVRNLIIDWITEHQNIPTSPDNNWSLVY